MTPEQFDRLLKIQERVAIALEQIAILLQQQLPRQPAPSYEAPLESFSNFDWSSIGAKVEMKDQYGVAVVSYRGEIYKRRSPDNVYGAAIFFSRAVRAENGMNNYERLIIFKPLKEFNIQPISRKAEQFVKS
jgi:hypothetical protein